MFLSGLDLDLVSVIKKKSCNFTVPLIYYLKLQFMTFGLKYTKNVIILLEVHLNFDT